MCCTMRVAANNTLSISSAPSGQHARIKSDGTASTDLRLDGIEAPQVDSDSFRERPFVPFLVRLQDALRHRSAALQRCRIWHAVWVQCMDVSTCIAVGTLPKTTGHCAAGLCKQLRVEMPTPALMSAFKQTTAGYRWCALILSLVTCGQHACAIAQQVPARLRQHILAVQSAQEGTQLLRVAVQQARDRDRLLNTAAH